MEHDDTPAGSSCLRLFSEKPAKEPHRDIPVGMNFFFLCRQRHLDPGVHQKHAEQVEHPVKTLDHADADEDEHDADEENLLLCELFLRQVYFHLLDAIQDSTRSRIFRRVCLDSIHTPLFCLKRYYYQFEQGDVKFLALQQQLRLIQISLD